ncbi:zinc finger CCCH domain-containing protein 17-like [Dorcoceras hygrometricum]|uniref:Zinc finger CCCH domain-containing protein 17-like n=1 Tax=Dorcoceras hygrometricum TaxID=472368 RepID=A0A2Z7DKK4_9LAMI|nr:zinc finger CCCH domain-containing protein 17-like [Dorcoceras hygrometricum]
METKTARRCSVFDRVGGQNAKNQVCSFWLAGKCNRNPCRFMHRESPPPQPMHYRKSATFDGLGEKPHKMTWKNPNYYSAKKGTVSSSERNISNGNRDEETQQKGSNVEADGSEISCVDKVQPKQCKYWVSGNCVHGDKCKDLHAWLSGSRITVLTKLQGHDKAISGVAIPSGSDKLFSAGRDKCIRTWDCNSGQCVGLVDINDDIGCLINEGPWVFIGLPNSVKAWNFQTLTEFSLNGFVGQVRCLIADNDLLFAGIEDGTILVWKWCTEDNIPKPTAMLKGHNGAISSFIIGAKKLFSGSEDHTIRAWDLETLQCAQVLSGHTGDITSLLCWGCYLFSASHDNTLKVWLSAYLLLPVVSYSHYVQGFLTLRGIHDMEDKPILICSCNDNTVRIYDLPSFEERGRIFTRGEAKVVETGVDRLFFVGDATGDIIVCRLQ